MTGRTWLRLLVVVFATLLLQSTVGLSVRIAGVHPDVTWLLPIATGLAVDADRGAIVGFVAGMASDLLLPTPLGLSALVGVLVGFGVGTLGDRGERRSTRWLAPLVALGASGVVVLAYAGLGSLLGQAQMLHVDLAAVIAVVGGINALLAPLAVRVIRWTFGEERTGQRRLVAAGSER